MYFFILRTKDIIILKIQLQKEASKRSLKMGFLCGKKTITNALEL